MSDYLIDKFDDPFAKSVTGTLWDIGKRFVGSSFEVLKDKKQAAEAAKNYADKYKSRYGSLQLLGMPKGVSLEPVYTPVRFLDKLSIRQFESIETLEEFYRDSNRRLQFGECQSQNGITVANQNQYLMVLGNPGSGKSTFLRRMGLEVFKGEQGKFNHNSIPVLLELKQFNTDKVDLIAAIAEEFKHFGFPPSKEFATKLLEQGKLLILLDGLDEAPKDFTNAVMNAIDNLVTHYEQNRFIASCRVAAYHSNFKHDFQVIELADFDSQQIEQFINNWFSLDLDKQSQTAEKCWKTLNNENNKAAKELAQTPLLLTFLCLVYSRKLNFPPNRSRLYGKALDILLEEWAAEKRVQQEEIYQGLHTDLEKVMLTDIAYEDFSKDRLFFQKQYLVDSIRDFLADTVDNPKYLDGQTILKEITIQQGIVVERAEDIYSFSHLTLQEYLTAQYISQQDSRIEELVTQHLTDKRWREVFLLVAGIKDNAGKMLKLMEKATQQLMDTPKLCNLLVWVEKVTDTTPGDFQPVGKRAIALAYAYANAYAQANAYHNLYAYAYTIVYAQVYSYNAKPDAISIALAYAKPTATIYTQGHSTIYSHPDVTIYTQAYINALNQFHFYIEWAKQSKIYRNINYLQLTSQIRELKEKVSYPQRSREHYKDFGRRIIESFLTSFYLTKEMLNLSQSELEVLDNYFYANLLMVQCKEAAVRVSKETWKGIESRMLLPVNGNQSE